MSMQPQQMLHSRDESPPDNGSHSLHHHIQSQDALYNIHTPHSTLYNNSNTIGSLSHHPNYSSEMEGAKAPATKINGFAPSNSRSSFSYIPNTSRPRHNPQSSALPPVNAYRESNNGFISSFNSDIFSSQLTSPTQSHMQPFDSRASYDYPNNQHYLANGAPNKNSHFNPNDVYNPLATSKAAVPLQQQHSTSHINNYSHQHTQFNANPQLSSQTPFGPHISSGMNGQGTGMLNGHIAPPGLGPMTAGGAGMQLQEEICTIFVVGFPDDMQEREFQNMFTFSQGFEAATLKIPNKEYTSYGANPGGRPNGFGMYGGSNDPYNLVTANQGGVVVDGGRDGTMASWPANALDESANPAHYSGSLGMAPRKQIIGFAKFRSKEEALAAKEILQGRRVDIEKGAVLKAEMAKKNLHTKRGVGPLPGLGGLAIGIPSQSLPGAGGTTGFGGPSMNGLNGSEYLGGEAISPREREPIGMSRLAQWRENDSVMGPIGSIHRDREQHEEDEWQRERDLNVMGINSIGSRGPRERAEEEERQRRRQQDIRLRAGNSTAFDAFHSVPAQHIPRQPGAHDILSLNGSPESSMLPNGAHSYSGMQQQFEDGLAPGPWDSFQHHSRHGLPQASSNRPSPPPQTSDDEASQSSVLERATQQLASSIHSLSDSRASSAAGSQRPGHGVLDLVNGISVLAVSTNSGNSSPQLPSPASGSSAGARNGIDQNPPINTLYVGNLPTSPVAPGASLEVLEDSLRDLFQTQAGFRRLSFKQKATGPMCFVEFEDVQFATKSLNDLYGNTLKGLVKGGGIRLSYSKNPLGVRTPTSAQGNGLAVQQQQAQPLPQGPLGNFAEERGSKLASTTMPPAPSYMASPPPRFFTTSNNGFGGPSSSAQLSNGSDVFLPRSSMVFTGFNNGNLTSSMSSSFSPFGHAHSSILDQHDSDHPRNVFNTAVINPPVHNIDAARVG